ncbi:MAG TPA: hypothetical protein VMU84_21570 [Thermoanaerobaculia bacterium]|nr:hypothetical protein [Thermoanaerobaculia bacterium]
MATKDSGYSPFVQAVAGDGTSPPDVRVLTGWLGASGDDGYARLYLDQELSTYVDIPRDAILYSEDIPDSRPAGARNVWVRRDAELKEGGSAITRAAKFLFGQVQQDFLGGGGGGTGNVGAPAGGVAQQIPKTRLCLTFTPGCEHTGITGNCQSNLIPCITQTTIGPRCHWRSIIDDCPSSLRPCATSSDHGCPCPTIAVTCPTPVKVCPSQTGPQCSDTRIPCSAIDACPSALRSCNTAGNDFCIPQTEVGPRCLATGVNCLTVGACPSAVDGCASSLGCTIDTTIFQQTVNQQFDQFGAARLSPVTSICPVQVTTFCPRTAVCPRPTLIRCPESQFIRCVETIAGCGSAIDACPSSLGCTIDTTIWQQQPQFDQLAAGRAQPVPATWLCPQPRPTWAHCPTSFCPVSNINCPTFGACPSAVDGCPSSLGCTIDTTIWQQTPVLQQQPQFQQQFQQPQFDQQFAQQQFGAPRTWICPQTALCPIRKTAICPIQTTFCPISVAGCPSVGACPSAVDGCASSLGCTIDTTIWQQTPVLQQQPQFQQPQFQQQFAQQQFGAPRTWICPQTAFCPIKTAICPIRTAICPVSIANCPTFGACPSAVDGCPSSLGCTIDTTIWQQTPVLQQQPQFQQQWQQFQPQFNQQFGSGPIKTITIPISQGCQTPVIACTPKSTPDPCSTAIPALCPVQARDFDQGAGQAQPGVTFTCFSCVNPNCRPGADAAQAQGPAGGYQTLTCIRCQTITCQQPGAAVSGPGWTCVCPPQHTIYPQCPTGHTGCVTFPCWDAAQQPQQAASGPGWTCLGCGGGTHYPQCNSHVGVCPTRPPCF